VVGVFGLQASERELDGSPAVGVFARFLESELPGITREPVAISLGAFGHALIVVATVLFFGLLGRLHAAAFLNWVLVALRLKPETYADGPPKFHNREQ